MYTSLPCYGLIVKQFFMVFARVFSRNGEYVVIDNISGPGIVSRMFPAGFVLVDQLADQIAARVQRECFAQA